MSNSNSPQAMFELFQKMANPFAFPLQNFLMPNLSLEDLEKKISELKSVHAWLQTNLGVLEVTIKSLEYQHALLSPASEASAPAPSPENPFLDPKNWPWNFVNNAEKAASEDTPKSPKREPPKA